MVNQMVCSILGLPMVKYAIKESFLMVYVLGNGNHGIILVSNHQ